MVHFKKHTFKMIQKKFYWKISKIELMACIWNWIEKKNFFPGEHDFLWLDHLKQKNQKYSVSLRVSSGIDVEFFFAHLVWKMFGVFFKWVSKNQKKLDFNTW